MINSKLIDMRNWFALKQELIQEISQSGLIGFDLETEDSRRHEGLNQFMKVNDEGHKSKGKRLIFDNNRTTICGFSWFCDESDTAYYLNLAHSDVENRIPWSEARQLLDARGVEAKWICHNAPFEITMMKKSLDYDLEDVICTLQLAVSAFNDDQYPEDKMFSCGFGGMRNMLAPIASAFANVEPYADLNGKQSELLGQIIGKTTRSTFSYNGLVKDLSYGYGLKKLTQSLFGYEQATFEETLDGKAHMGQITGEQCCAYGAEDSYWAVRIFHRILPMLPFQNDKLMNTFFDQENPMIYVFSQISQNGMKINLEQVEKRRVIEREEYAIKVRELQKVVRGMLPFPAEMNQWLLKEKWYKQLYRTRIENWAGLDLSDDPFTAVYTVAGAVPNAWAEERGLAKSKGPNFAHYMMMRTLMYDLPGIKPIYDHGKVGSDKDARAKLVERNPEVAPLVNLINEMASIDTRMKLYLTPYLQLCDPETKRVYPVVSSMLNSRRMAASFPNPMQLAKRGESTYIRGFYLPDEDDHVIISIDWSQIELVLIGDFSRDTAFREAYGQIPFQDLHWKATADMHGISVEEAKALPNGKDLRTKVGKGANFNYWYSGALSTVGDSMGWSSDKMWEMTENYRETFAEAEEWRVDLINEAREKGYVTLPDGHRRHKYEASYAWQNLWRERFGSTTDVGLQNFGDLFVRKLTNRAANQIVNSMVQGSCATLAKRSILEVNRQIALMKLRARFMIPIHDELVFSVHRDDVVEFIKMAKFAMCDHPDIIKTLCVDATASMGRTFEPYHPDKAPLGQIELDEAPPILGFEKDSRLNDAEIEKVITYLFNEEVYANAA